MRTDLERSRQNLTKLSTLLDRTNPAELATANLIQRFHRRSRYRALAIGVWEESRAGETARWILEAAKWVPASQKTRPEWWVIRYGITEQSIRFQPCSSRHDALRTVRQRLGEGWPRQRQSKRREVGR